ncbi:transposase [Stutzerimonas nitrititolerans]|uniref:transposase n=1 Tax=Stutzerimonas nitrititolerans TaxID=2482751 RepID=UPI0028A09040|nr:transposase [Stutzerimonas nitrititolerans]
MHKERFDKVGMQELDQHLAKVVEAARVKPVSVFRYGVPWVWIVSQDAWQHALKEVSGYIQPNHYLVLARPQIEDIIAEHAAMLDALASERHMQIPPRTLISVLLLQLLYSVQSEHQLHEQLHYNLLFRWFAGLHLNQVIWDFPSFDRDVSALLDCPDAVHLIRRIIAEVFSDRLLQMPEVSMNFSLLHAWLGKHTGVTDEGERRVATVGG